MKTNDNLTEVQKSIRSALEVLSDFMVKGNDVDRVFMCKAFLLRAFDDAGKCGDPPEEGN